jgi:hypothetical protein
VKQLRILVLVLLAVLLPVRGAMAVAMGCAGGPGTSTLSGGSAHAHHAEPAHGPPEHTAGPHAAGHPAHDGVSFDEPTGGSAAGAAHGSHGDGHGEHAGTCQACASGCCVTPLASALPTLAGLPAAERVAYPALTAQAPVFHSGGPDRPPRTI